VTVMQFASQNWPASVYAGTIRKLEPSRFSHRGSSSAVLWSLTGTFQVEGGRTLKGVTRV
jgi:hypothetical protein